MPTVVRRSGFLCFLVILRLIGSATCHLEGLSDSKKYSCYSNVFSPSPNFGLKIVFLQFLTSANPKKNHQQFFCQTAFQGILIAYSALFNLKFSYLLKGLFDLFSC